VRGGASQGEGVRGERRYKEPARWHAATPSPDLPQLHWQGLLCRKGDQVAACVPVGRDKGLPGW
jgi:hypothetical protein